MASQEANVEGNKVENIDNSRFWRWFHLQAPNQYVELSIMKVVYVIDNILNILQTLWK